MRCRGRLRGTVWRVGGGHTHGTGGGDAQRLAAPPRIRRVLAALVVLAGLAGAAGAVALWPDGEASARARERFGDPYAGVSFVSGTVRTASESVCEGAPEDRLPDGSIPETAVCVTATVRLDEDLSPDGGRTVEVPVPPQVKRAGLGEGDRVRLVLYPAQEAQDGQDALPATYGWVDHDRRVPLGLLGIAFAVVVVGVARLKGLAAMAGLAIAYPTITVFMLPALRAGQNPVLVALTGASLIMIVLLYLAHGVSTKTTVALVGTLAGLLLTAGLAWWVTVAARLDGLSSEENYQLSRLTTGAGLNGIILCGVIIAGLGVLNDVTIAQTSSIWELRALAPQAGARDLFTSGMRIGRDHLASTVYTIAFAYAGAALPTLLLIDLYQQPLAEVLNGGQVAEEIIRTLVGSIGLVLTIPLTTAIAALVATSLAPVAATDDDEYDGRPPPGRDARDLWGGLEDAPFFTGRP